MVTWKKLIEEEFEIRKDSWNNLVMMSPSDGKWLDYYFDDESKNIEGFPFTLWTKTRVYFPLAYEGIESVGSVSRVPNNLPTKHL